MPNPGMTKRALADAMKKFMAERPLSKISVGDIVEHCQLNRNSFYYHFKDKYDLVNWIFYTEFVAGLSEEDTDSPWVFLAHICSFFCENRPFYLNALSVTGQNSFSEYFAEMMKTVLSSRPAGSKPDWEDENEDFYITFFVDGFLASIYRWLRDGIAISPEKLVELLKTAATGTALTFLREPDLPPAMGAE